MGLFTIRATGRESLVRLSGEEAPRLRSHGRLAWLGAPRAGAFDYHDPDSGTESFWHGDTGCWVELDDCERFSPRLPEGVTVTVVGRVV